MKTSTDRAAYTEHLLGALSRVTAALEAGADGKQGLHRLRADILAALRQAQAGLADSAQPWGGCR